MVSGAGLNGREIHKLVVGIAAINAEIIGAPSTAVHGYRSGLVAAIDERVSQLRLHSRLQLQQLVGIAGVERELADGAISPLRRRVAY